MNVVAESVLFYNILDIGLNAWLGCPLTVAPVSLREGEGVENNRYIVGAAWVVLSDVSVAALDGRCDYKLTLIYQVPPTSGSRSLGVHKQMCRLC